MTGIEATLSNAYDATFTTEGEGFWMSIPATANIAARGIQHALRGLHCGTETNTINIDGDDFQKMLADIIIKAIG